MLEGVKTGRPSHSTLIQNPVTMNSLFQFSKVKYPEQCSRQQVDGSVFTVGFTFAYQISICCI